MGKDKYRFETNSQAHTAEDISALEMKSWAQMGR